MGSVLCASVAGLAVVLAGSWVAAGEEAVRATTCYVSTAGNDAWSGRLPEPNADKTDGPFASLGRARDEMRKVGPGSPRRVIIRRGVYRVEETFTLGKEDSGTESHPAVWQAAPGEEVRLVGGLALTAQAFRPVTDAAVLGRLEEAARGKVFQVDLAPLGVKMPKAFPGRFRGPLPLPELFFNDQRMTPARWPNEGWATIAKIVEAGSEPRGGDSSGRPGVFEYAGDRPARWNADRGVWLHGYWCFDWYDEVIRVKSIEPKNRRIAFAEPHLYGLRQGNPSPRRFRAIHLLEELDQPGEYYVDLADGRLYFWPPAELAGARVVVGTLDGPVVALREASHVVLRGLVVEASQGDGIEIRGGTANGVFACCVRNVRQLGVAVYGGLGHRVEGCDIHDTGTGGIVLAGGDRRTLSPAGHQAVNNHIWRFSRHQLTYANAVLLEGVGNRAAHNLIHDAPHQAIGVGGNDHVFEYNVVHHVCLETDDCGAFYKGRNPSCRGNLVRYNYWHHIGSPMGHGNAAVYFDDGDGGDTVVGNVFYRCGDPGRGSFGTVFSHGGHDNLAENNVFVECKRALGSAPWDDQRWKRALEGGEGCDWQNRLLKEVDITRPPYTTRYPSLIGFLNPRPGQARINHAVRNVLVSCAEVKSGNWQVKPEENWVTEGDPGFVDAAKGDFRLRPDAEVFRRLPGFQPIPFEKMGLYLDAYRRTLPAEPR
jgi:hypothetical protein